MNKGFTIATLGFLILVTLTLTATSQYNWKLSRDKDGIKVYESDTKNSDFKSIKVECTLPGDYDKFISVMDDVSHYKDWVYRTKTLTLSKEFHLRNFIIILKPVYPGRCRTGMRQA